MTDSQNKKPAIFSEVGCMKNELFVPKTYNPREQ